MKYLIALMIAASTAPAIASADLARSKNCLACHAVDRKLVGPSFKDVAGRYTERDISHMTTVIQRGGSGRWGPIPMPANAAITKEEAEALARWVLEQSKDVL
jgi:cytochrome c